MSISASTTASHRTTKPIEGGVVSPRRTAKIVGLGGSRAGTSRSLAALRLAADAAEEQGAEVTIFELRELDLDFYAPGREPAPHAVKFADSCTRHTACC